MQTGTIDITETALTSELNNDDFLNIANLLVGHRINSISIAMQWVGVQANWKDVEADLHQIGIYRCQDCRLWYWSDQMRDCKYCNVICGGHNA